MKNVQKGFTLIELMIVVAIIGILAAIAIPAYQDYITRSKITELVTAASSCKTSISEYYNSQNGYPPDQASSGCVDQSTKYVSSLTVGTSGVITVAAKTGTGAIPTTASGNYVLVPSANSNAQIDWTCNGTGTTIPKKYLPANCR